MYIWLHKAARTRMYTRRASLTDWGATTANDGPARAGPWPAGCGPARTGPGQDEIFAGRAGAGQGVIFTVRVDPGPSDAFF